MTKLQAEPFLLSQNSIVQARTQASNSNDWGEASEMNVDGGIISVIPDQM